MEIWKLFLEMNVTKVKKDLLYSFTDDHEKITKIISEMITENTFGKRFPCSTYY